MESKREIIQQVQRTQIRETADFSLEIMISGRQWDARGKKSKWKQNMQMEKTCETRIQSQLFKARSKQTLKKGQLRVCAVGRLTLQ